ncbi:MAG: hypothetical protein ACREEW_02635, partial [Caulobacteraceae bacterium]
MQNDNRNFIIFIVITFVLLLAYEQFVLGPMEKRQKVLQAQAHAEEAAQKKAAAAAAGAPLIAPHV